MDLDLEAFMLAPVTMSRFQELADAWSWRGPILNGVLPGNLRGNAERHQIVMLAELIDQPRYLLEYPAFLEMLSRYPYADQLCVNDHGRWVKNYVRMMRDEDVARFASIAAADRRKRNYLELKLSLTPGSRQGIRSSLEFTESPDGFIAYALAAPYPSPFHWQRFEGNGRTIYALATPGQ